MRAANPIVPALAAALLAVLASAAGAHPHVWVSVEATVLYENGSITGLQEAWTFDEFYTAQAIEGLDKNGDGKYDRAELTELAKVNVDGLKEFDYFTHAKLGTASVPFKEPVDYWLEHTDKGILTLHFRLPLQQPILAKAGDPGAAGEFTFSINDPSFFIAFDLAEGHPVKLGTGAPAGCSAVIHEPGDNATSDAQKLNEAFSGVMGDGGTTDFGGAKTVAVHCAKS